VLEGSGGATGRFVTGKGQAWEDSITGYSASLGQPIHTLAYFSVHPALFIDKVMEVVLFPDIFRDVLSLHANVLFFWELIVEVEVFDVKCCGAAIGSADDVIDEHLGCD
jgi:hypothetical protein